MRSVLILAILTLFFASCHNEVLNLPGDSEVKGYEFCKYKDKDGFEQCKSTYEMTKNPDPENFQVLCEINLSGKVYDDKILCCRDCRYNLVCGKTCPEVEASTRK